MRGVHDESPGLPRRNTKEWAEVPDPVIRDNSDVIIQIDAVTLCGSDLHVLKGDVPAVTGGRMPGTKPSAPLSRSAPCTSGDRVVASCNLRAWGGPRRNGRERVPGATRYE